MPQPVHCEPAPQNWPFWQSLLLRQLPAMHVPFWQTWFAPKAVTHWVLVVQLVQKWVLVLHSLPLQSEF